MRIANIPTDRAMSSEPRTAAEIFVDGIVQGVGYRNFVERKASQLGLAGFVMNLKDGRVRVRVEGKRGLIEELARDLEKGPPISHVQTVAVMWRPVSSRSIIAFRLIVFSMVGTAP